MMAGVQSVEKSRMNAYHSSHFVEYYIIYQTCSGGCVVYSEDRIWVHMLEKLNLKNAFPSTNVLHLLSNLC